MIPLTLTEVHGPVDENHTHNIKDPTPYFSANKHPSLNKPTVNVDGQKT